MLKAVMIKIHFGKLVNRYRYKTLNVLCTS